MAVIFGYATAQNRKAAYGGKKKEKKKKKQKSDKEPIAELEEPKASAAVATEETAIVPKDAK